jgi:hypothetical protein
VPISLFVTELIKINRQPISVGGGLRYLAESPSGGPDDVGLRLILAYLFPKG